MKKLLLLFLAVISLASSSTKTAKIYQKAQEALGQKHYFDVLDLLDKLPKEERTSAQYNKSVAQCMDSMRRYTDAIKYYTLYVDQTKDSMTGSRLALLKDNEEKRLAAQKAKFERIKDCPKCHGTDSIPTEIVCVKCSGFKIVKHRCTRCNGKGNTVCGSCAGTGTIMSGSISTACNRCSGTGSLTCMQCEHGYISEDCRACSGSGYQTIQVKCDRHD